MNILKFILILIIINIVKSQTIPSNDKVKLYSLPSNVYQSYVSGPSYQSCEFKESYVMLNSISPNISTGDPSMYLSIYMNQISISFRINASVNVQTFQFTINEEEDPTISTDFTINLLCEDINYSSLEFNVLNDPPIQLDSGSIFFYFQLKGSKYGLTNLNFEYLNPNISSNTFVVSNELYYTQMYYGYGYYYFSVNSIEINLVFPNKTFNYKFKPMYNSSLSQTIFYETFPINLTSNVYDEYGFNIAPNVVFSSNLNATESLYFLLHYNVFSRDYLPKKIGHSTTSKTSFKYLLSLTNLFRFPTIDYTFIYNLGNSTVSIPFMINTKVFQWNTIPIGMVVNMIDRFALYINSSTYSAGESGYRNTPFIHSYFDLNFISEFPFGFVEGNLNSFKYQTTYYLKSSTGKNNDNFIINEAPSGDFPISYANPSPSFTSDTQAPIITLFELEHIIGFKYLMRIKASDLSSFYIQTQGVGSDLNSRYESLVEGVYNNGTFEIVIDILYFPISLKLIDYYSNTYQKTQNNYIAHNSNNIPMFLTYPIPQIDLIIENVTFLINDIDIYNKPCYNTIYFNSTTIPKDYPLLFRIIDPTSYDLLGFDGKIEPFSVYYDEELKLFYSNFIVPMNIIFGEIPYMIYSPLIDVQSLVLPKLRVSNTIFDNDPPMISSIINLNGFNKVGWRIQIIDDVNGFKKGYVKAVGSVDSSIYKFNFTIENVLSGGTNLNGQYDLEINVETPCITQNFTIEYIYLEDNNNYYSKFSRFFIKRQDLNPLRYLLDNELPTLLKTTSTCSPSIVASNPPFYGSFSMDRSTVDVGSLNRKVNIEFEYIDQERGLQKNQLPIVYLTSADMINLEFESKIKSVDSLIGSIIYTCEVEIPIGYGYPNPILVSIYGFINKGGLFSGLSNDQILMSIDTVYTFNPILTGYEKYYMYSKNDIIVYGKTLNKTLSVDITYSNGLTKNYIPKRIIGETVLVIEKDKTSGAPEITGPFVVKAIFQNGLQSNNITIYPIYYNTTNIPRPTLEPTNTPTNTPTNSPNPTKEQKCFGAPLCGGNKHGYCNEDLGCICYSPYTGKDCSSQVIIVPQPETNQTNPTTEIPVTDDGSDSDEIINKVFYKSLISLNGLREISIDNKEINYYQFSKWVYTQIDSSTSQYFTNLTINNQIINITTTLKWFENETTLNFAYQNLTMLPSSMKYTIEISNYPFLSKLNSLQLIMFASFISSKTNDICLTKEFDNTSTGDNYLKIQIENRSLYGRFIKRGIVNEDKKVVTLTNQLLDSQMNSINSPHQGQSYIGISIPWFSSNAIIDPDFSVLIDSNSASQSSNPLCTNNNNSKLSSTKIAGIVIGSVAFAAIISISTIYFVVKKKQQKKFISNMDRKLKQIN